MATPDQLYLDLIKRMLCRWGFEEGLRPAAPHGRVERGVASALGRLLALRGFALGEPVRFDADKRAVGADHPAWGETMIGMKRLDNLQWCVQTVIKERIPGDLIETGVWRGGACILMRAVLAAHGDDTRAVWAADSFQGLPPPDPEKYPVDKGDRHWTHKALAVSVEEVRANFDRYGLLDEQVRFLEGMFSETLATAPISQLAVLRLDGDMYGSTIEALDALYPKLSVGGFVIVDDWTLKGARAAVNDFRGAHGISDAIVDIDFASMFWRRSAD